MSKLVRVNNVFGVAEFDVENPSRVKLQDEHGAEYWAMFE